jgi:hypothetical protein
LNPCAVIRQYTLTTYKPGLISAQNGRLEQWFEAVTKGYNKGVTDFVHKIHQMTETLIKQKENAMPIL